MIADFAPNPLRLGDGCASCTRRPFSHWLLLYAPPGRPATNQRTRNTPACFPAAFCTPVRRKDSIFTNFTFSNKIWRSSSSSRFPASLAFGSGLGTPISNQGRCRCELMLSDTDGHNTSHQDPPLPPPFLPSSPPFPPPPPPPPSSHSSNSSVSQWPY